MHEIVQHNSFPLIALQHANSLFYGRRQVRRRQSGDGMGEAARMCMVPRPGPCFQAAALAADLQHPIPAFSVH